MSRLTTGELAWTTHVWFSGDIPEIHSWPPETRLERFSFKPAPASSSEFGCGPVCVSVCGRAGVRRWTEQRGDVTLGEVTEQAGLQGQPQ